jgi:AAA+ ATPase superfamily predicted ATPase
MTVKQIPKQFPKQFIGRQEELQSLAALLKKKTASLVVIKGRRRIGKSRLVQEFAKHFDAVYTFSGLAPSKQTTTKGQLNEFARQMSRTFNIPYVQYDDWGDVFWMLASQLKTGKILLFFDEISWMGSKDPDFLAKIKNLWDLYLQKNNQLMFVVCGSASAWIEKNILSTAGFVGRISYTMTLKELSLDECNQFWSKTIAPYEKLKVLSITGGIPKYLEEINPKECAEDNIKRLCFTEGGFLVDEFERMFSDVLLRDSPLYKKIIHVLCAGPKDAKAIQAALNIDTQRRTQGRLLEYLDELELAGFIARDYTWNLETGTDGKLSHYRLVDNYMHFYIKYIEKNMAKIRRGTYAMQSLTGLPGWTGIMGLQFENLVLNNRRTIHQRLGIKPEDIICENPFFQRTTKVMPGCQIDYMIQTKFHCLYVCEIKFSKHVIDVSVVKEVQQKVQALRYPKGFSIRPALIHVNGVHPDVIDQDYFTDIIAFPQ